ncbi:MAG: hypothetical protein ACRCZK_06190 [Oscillospiraceae bacterium]
MDEIKNILNKKYDLLCDIYLETKNMSDVAFNENIEENIEIFLIKRNDLFSTLNQIDEELNIILEKNDDIKSILFDKDADIYSVENIYIPLLSVKNDIKFQMSNILSLDNDLKKQFDILKNEVLQKIKNINVDKNAVKYLDSINSKTDNDILLNFKYDKI